MRKYLGILISIVTIAAAFLAGISTDSNSPEVIRTVLQASSFLNNAVLWFRDNVSGGGNIAIVFAVLAGAAAAFNPCGFVMLPTYLTLYISDNTQKTPLFAARRAGSVSSMLGLGFIAVFGVFGSMVTLGAQGLIRVAADAFPWIGLSLGVILSFVGAYLIGGGKVYMGVAQRYASQIGDAKDRSLRGYFMFGVSYALASLSCALPLFLTIIATSVTSGGITGGITQFIAFALGMWSIVAILTVGIALFKGAFTKQLRSVMPFITPLSAVILVIVGAYLVFYWLTEGGLKDIFI